MFGSGTNVLAVNPELPVHSVKELIALAKAKPGQLNYASAGVGSFQHLGGELFKLKAGVDIVHVPFRGGGPAMIDVIGGHTKIVFSSLIQTTPHIKSGQLRGLATGGAKRNPVLPDLPTIAEAGVPGYEANNWWGMLAPAGTPPAIVEKLNKAVSAALDAPELQKQFEAQGATVVKMSPAEFGAYIEVGNGQVGRSRQARAHHGPIGASRSTAFEVVRLGEEHVLPRRRHVLDAADFVHELDVLHQIGRRGGVVDVGIGDHRHQIVG